MGTEKKPRAYGEAPGRGLGIGAALPSAVIGSLGEEGEMGIGKGRFCPQGDGRGSVAAVHGDRGRDGRGEERAHLQGRRRRSPPSAGDPAGMEMAVRSLPTVGASGGQAEGGEGRNIVPDEGRYGGPPELRFDGLVLPAVREVEGDVAGVGLVYCWAGWDNPEVHGSSNRRRFFIQ